MQRSGSAHISLVTTYVLEGTFVSVIICASTQSDNSMPPTGQDDATVQRHSVEYLLDDTSCVEEDNGRDVSVRTKTKESSEETAQAAGLSICYDEYAE